MKTIILLFLLIPIFISAQQQDATWNYPIRNGTEEWAKLNSFGERLNAFNIPDSLSEHMSTKNLVETCLKYPYWILITSRNNNQEGYDFIKSKFNGFRELEKREDAFIELFKIYEKMHPEKKNNYNSLVERGKFGYQFLFIELLISQPNIITNINKNEVQLIIQKAISVYELKVNPNYNYSLYMVSSTGLLIGRILKLHDPIRYSKLILNFSECDRFIQKGSYVKKEILDQIYNDATTYL